MGEELRGARRHVQYDDQLRAGGCHVLLHASTTAGHTSHPETCGLMDWLPPILGLFLFMGPGVDAGAPPTAGERAAAHVLCAEKYAARGLPRRIKVEIQRGRTVIYMHDSGPLFAKQAVCLAPRLPPEPTGE